MNRTMTWKELESHAITGWFMELPYLFLCGLGCPGQYT